MCVCVSSCIHTKGCFSRFVCIRGLAAASCCILFLLVRDFCCSPFLVVVPRLVCQHASCPPLPISFCSWTWLYLSLWCTCAHTRVGVHTHMFFHASLSFLPLAAWMSRELFQLTGGVNVLEPEISGSPDVAAAFKDKRRAREGAGMKWCVTLFPSCPHPQGKHGGRRGNPVLLRASPVMFLALVLDHGVTFGFLFFF